MKPRILPYLALLGAILALTLSAFFVRWAAAPAPVFAFYRVGIGGLAITPFLARRSNRTAPKAGGLVWLPLLGGVFTALDLTLWNTGLGLTTIANATLLGNTAPIWVVLFLRVVAGQRFSGRFWSGLGLALLGAGIVLGYDAILRPHFGTGDLLSIGSGMFYAGYYLATDYGRRSLGVASYMVWMSAAACATLLVIIALMGYPLTGYPLRSVLAFLGAGLVVQGLGYASVAYALGHLPASVVSPTLILQPVFSALLAIPLYGEGLVPVQWLGILAVLSGIFLVNRSASPRPAAAAAEGSP